MPPIGAEVLVPARFVALAAEVNYPGDSMRRIGLVSVLFLSLAARAEPRPERTWLSAVGVGAVGVGLGLAGFGIGQQLIASDAATLVKAYAVPTSAEAPAVSLLQKRAASASGLAVGSFIGAAVLLAGGIVALIFDTPAAIAFTPLSGGGAVVAHVSF
jgi:hypothetical protein